MNSDIVITVGGLSMLLLELVKWILRNFILKNPTFDFSQGFYVVAVPTMNVLVLPLMALLGVAGYTMPTEWIEFARSAIYVAVGSAISLLTYSGGLSKLKDLAKKG